MISRIATQAVYVEDQPSAVRKQQRQGKGNCSQKRQKSGFHLYSSLSSGAARVVARRAYSPAGDVIPDAHPGRSASGFYHGGVVSP